MEGVDCPTAVMRPGFRVALCWFGFYRRVKAAVVVLGGCVAFTTVVLLVLLNCSHW